MYIIIGSKEKVTKEADLSIFTVLADNFKSLIDAKDWFLINKNNENHYLNLYKHVHIICEDVMVYEYWYRHKWLPKDDWFMLAPVYGKIKEYVTAPNHLPYKHLSINNDPNPNNLEHNFVTNLATDLNSIIDYYGIKVTYEQVLKDSSEDVPKA